MKKLCLIFNFLLLIYDFSFSQPAIQWQKCLGGLSTDEAHSVQQTIDGGFIIAGFTLSNDTVGDVSGYHGGKDFWIVKLDGSGTMQWQKCLGGTSDDHANSILQTTDGGFIVVGMTSSNDGDVIGYLGSRDFWVVKLDYSGNILWQKCLGGTAWDEAYSVKQTFDGGFIVGGFTYSNDIDVSGNHGFIRSDYWVIKLDSSGTLQWQKCLGGSDDDEANAVHQTADGGFIVAGYSLSNNGDLTSNQGDADYWIVKLDASGTIQWQKSLGGMFDEKAYSVQQITDGGFVVAGFAASNNGDVSGNHNFSNAGGDYWIVKLDSSGSLLWQKCLGGTSFESATSIEQTPEGGFIICGYAFSNNGDLTANHGGPDYWVVKLDAATNIQWQKILGGTDDDRAYSMQMTTDGGLIIAGGARSSNDDVTNARGGGDFWVVKLSPFVGIKEETGSTFLKISPNPFSIIATINFGKEVRNASFSLYNFLGEKVVETTGINGERFQFNRGNLPNGIYVFEVLEKEKRIARGKAVVY